MQAVAALDPAAAERLAAEAERQKAATEQTPAERKQEAAATAAAGAAAEKKERQALREAASDERAAAKEAASKKSWRPPEALVRWPLRVTVAALGLLDRPFGWVGPDVRDLLGKVSLAALLMAAVILWRRCFSRVARDEFQISAFRNPDKGKSRNSAWVNLPLASSRQNHPPYNSREQRRKPNSNDNNTLTRPCGPPSPSRERGEETTTRSVGSVDPTYHSNGKSTLWPQSR